MALPPYTLISEEEAVNRYQLEDEYAEESGDEHIMVFEGDVELDGLDTDELEGPDGEIINGVVVTGSLKSNGDLLCGNEESFLVVLGNVETKSLQSSGSLVLIKGNLKANYVTGDYNHGWLMVEGDLHANYLLNSDHHIEISGKVDAVGVDLYGGQGGEYKFGKDDILDELMEDEYPELELIQNALDEGRPILKG